MARDRSVHSGFVGKDDYLLTFAIADPERRARLVELCAGEWQGDEVVPNTWEIASTRSPDEMERALLDVLGDGDRAAYYYLADDKRIFRVVVR